MSNLLLNKKRPTKPTKNAPVKYKRGILSLPATTSAINTPNHQQSIDEKIVCNIATGQMPGKKLTTNSSTTNPVDK